MKSCPQCNGVYHEDYGFCLNDGTALLENDAEPETVVNRNLSTAPIEVSSKNRAFCPSCGLEIKTNSKFCSRCGFALGVVSDLLAHGGYLPQLAELNKKKASIYTRKNGLAFSLIWFLFFLLILTPLLSMLRAGPLSGMTAILGIFGGLILMISSLIFLKPERKLPLWLSNEPAQLYGQPQHGALPPHQAIPASSYVAPPTGNWRDTNDLQPTSVTEETTRLLHQDEK